MQHPLPSVFPTAYEEQSADALFAEWQEGYYSSEPIDRLPNLPSPVFPPLRLIPRSGFDTDLTNDSMGPPMPSLADSPSPSSSNSSSPFPTSPGSFYSEYDPLPYPLPVVDHLGTAYPSVGFPFDDSFLFRRERSAAPACIDTSLLMSGNEQTMGDSHSSSGSVTSGGKRPRSEEDSDEEGEAGGAPIANQVEAAGIEGHGEPTTRGRVSTAHVQSCVAPRKDGAPHPDTPCPGQGCETMLNVSRLSHARAHLAEKHQNIHVDANGNTQRECTICDKSINTNHTRHWDFHIGVTFRCWEAGCGFQEKRWDLVSKHHTNTHVAKKTSKKRKLEKKIKKRDEGISKKKKRRG